MVVIGGLLKPSRKIFLYLNLVTTDIKVNKTHFSHLDISPEETLNDIFHGFTSVSPNGEFNQQVTK
jgi:hypothetical protein